MAFYYNRITLVGRLTKEPEHRLVGDSSQKTQFTLAVNRSFKTKAGEVEADFIPVVVWGKLAKFCGSYLKKGLPVLVEGRVSVRSYDKDSEKRWVTEVIATGCQVLARLEDPAVIELVSDCEVVTPDVVAAPKKK
ncbi:single-stranded DNA-binding protein [bacterium]|jgi:single-strand DNA-binding protein|nr:single-stranded DNA-binding protein [bacterium]